MSNRSLCVHALLGLGLGFALYSGVATAAPDANMLDAATREQPAVIETLKSLVLIESGSGDAVGLAKMANLLDERLRSLGFTTERRKTSAGAGADIVIGTISGTGHQKVMLMAHMDTVYETGILQSQPYKLDGNKLYGPGIADDKGGIAVILHSSKILADADWTDYATLTVLFNPDEEVGSMGSGEMIAALVFGDASADGTRQTIVALAGPLLAQRDGLLPSLAAGKLRSRVMLHFETKGDRER